VPSGFASPDRPMPDRAAPTSDARFLSDVTRNPVNAAILTRWDAVGLPDAWLVAGCLFQTVWNLRCGRVPTDGIRDYDLFYFDGADTGEAAERSAQARVAGLFDDLGVTVEVANQARVHQWYPSFFGRPYEPSISTRDGIGRFLVRETCVGVQPGLCHAPYGLGGIYAGTLTPNPRVPYPELFARKVASYRARWPALEASATG
jgi:uncharacterized protein